MALYFPNNIKGAQTPTTRYGLEERSKKRGEIVNIGGHGGDQNQTGRRRQRVNPQQRHSGGVGGGEVPLGEGGKGKWGR